MSNMGGEGMQSEEKHDLRYKSIRELVWGLGFLVLGSESDGFLAIVCLVLGIFALISHLNYNWKLR